MSLRFSQLLNLSSAGRDKGFADVIAEVFQLMSATAEVFFRRNLGRRYVPTLVRAFLLFGFVRSVLALRSEWTLPSVLFLLGFFLRTAYHYAFNWFRPGRGLPEPHSLSTGDSWGLWRRFRFSQSRVQRFVEPVFCLVVVWMIWNQDLALALWIAAAGGSLFMKEQMNHFRNRRQVLDIVDNRIESQLLSAAVDRYINPRSAETERPNRARLAPNLVAANRRSRRREQRFSHER